MSGIVAILPEAELVVIGARSARGKIGFYPTGELVERLVGLLRAHAVDNQNSEAIIHDACLSGSDSLIDRKLPGNKLLMKSNVAQYPQK